MIRAGGVVEERTETASKELMLHQATQERRPKVTWDRWEEHGAPEGDGYTVKEILQGIGAILILLFACKLLSQQPSKPTSTTSVEYREPQHPDYVPDYVDYERDYEPDYDLHPEPYYEPDHELDYERDYEPCLTTFYVDVETADVRSGPGGEYPLQGIAHMGDTVCIHGDVLKDYDEEGIPQDLWWQVEVNGIHGYVHNSVVSSHRPSAAKPPILAPRQGGCPGGCIEHKPGCDVKGNISIETGEKIYHVPNGEYYDSTVIRPEYGEKWFCTEVEAIAAGWRRSKR